MTQGKAGLAPTLRGEAELARPFFKSQQQTKSCESSRTVTRRAIMTHNSRSRYVDFLIGVKRIGLDDP